MFMSLSVCTPAAQPIPIPYLPHLSKWMSRPPQAHLTIPPQSLGTQVSQEVGASSLNKAGPCSPLLYMYEGTLISWRMLPGWWLHVWEISRVQVTWDCWSSKWGSPCPQLLPSFPQFNHSGPWHLFICWVEVSASVSVRYLFGPLRGQPH